MSEFVLHNFGWLVNYNVNSIHQHYDFYLVKF